mgnify:CR=1 FL=1
MFNPNSHRQIMLGVLKTIYTHVELGSFLGFKGGTAAYFLYNLPRFSVDLDFDLLKPEKEQWIFEKLKVLLAKFGKLEEAIIKKYSLFYLINYQTGLQKLKVEISRRTLTSQTYEVKQYAGIPLLVMSQSDMFANKLTALTERKELANRDLFDIHFFLDNNWPINTKLLEERTGMPHLQYLQKCIATVETVSNDSILSKMGELLDNKGKAWVKTHLKKELLVQLKIRHANYW